MGARVYLSDLTRIVGEWPKPLRAMRKLEAAKLAVREAVKDTGRGSVIFVLAEPVAKTPKVVLNYPHKTAVAFFPGQEPRMCRSTNTPGPGREAVVKMDGRSVSIRFRGRVLGGWLVEPARPAGPQGGRE